MARIAITCGDPSGLGPELIERCLVERDYGDSRFLVFGHQPWLERLASGAKAPVECVALSDRDFAPGDPEPDGARLAIAAMEEAAQACLQDRCDAVVTGPISKELCSKVGYGFPGQTEFFADRWGGDPTMAFVGERLRICLATWHIPLRDVPERLTEEALRRSVLAAVELGNRLGAESPRVLVCGLNPHAGEGGLLGEEEKARLNPWLATLKAEVGARASIVGCAPGDTVFARAMKGEADVVVALYHDQGLAPFKAVDFDSGVNVSLGLAHLRLSPDHGTGFDIAGKGLASPSSMDHALSLASALLSAKRTRA